jgi:hypothetical protein
VLLLSCKVNFYAMCKGWAVSCKLAINICGYSSCKIPYFSRLKIIIWKSSSFFPCKTLVHSKAQFFSNKVVHKKLHKCIKKFKKKVLKGSQRACTQKRSDIL